MFVFFTNLCFLYDWGLSQKLTFQTIVESFMPTMV
jgi:hypothetical protein